MHGGVSLLGFGRTGRDVSDCDLRSGKQDENLNYRIIFQNAPSKFCETLCDKVNIQSKIVSTPFHFLRRFLSISTFNFGEYRENDSQKDHSGT